MIDVQKHAPEVPIPIDRVGVRGVKVPLWARDRANLKQRTVVQVSVANRKKKTNLTGVAGKAADERRHSCGAKRNRFGLMAERDQCCSTAWTKAGLTSLARWASQSPWSTRR